MDGIADKNVRANESGKAPKDRFWLAMTAILFVVYCLFSLANTSQDWLYHHDGWAGARRSINAKNYLRVGYIESKLGSLDNLGDIVGKDGKPEKYNYYWHHPPMTNIILSVTFRVFGDSPATARFTIAFISWIAFLFLFLALHKLWGYERSFYGLLFLTFQPIFATYLNFVNYEMVIFASMTAMIFFYEKYLSNPKIVYAFLIFIFMFTGSFTDFPMFPFLFWFWLFTGIARISKTPGKYHFHLIYVGAVFIVVFLVAWHLFSMHTGWKSFYDLFFYRYDQHGHRVVSFLKLLKRWDYYYGFFTPTGYLMTAYYLGDVLVRLFRKRLDRTDGYIFAFGLAGLCYLLPLKAAAHIHEYTAWYMAPFIAVAAGTGLYRMACLVRRFNRAAAFALVLVFIISLVAYSVPKIFVKRTHPIYEFSKRIESIKSGTKLDYELDIDIAAYLTRKSCEPDERVLVMPGKKVRMEFNYYIDRTFKKINEPRQFFQEVKTRKYPRVLVHAYYVPGSFLSYLARRYNFINYKHFYIFDLRGDWDRSTVKRKMIFPQSDVERYFTSLIHGRYEVIDDPAESFDFSLKYDKIDSAEYWRGKLDKAPDGLTKSVAMYNRRKSEGKKSSLESVKKYLSKTPKETAIGDLRCYGYRIEKLADGRREISIVFTTTKWQSANYRVKIFSEADHKDPEFRKMVGKSSIEAHTVIPVESWNPGWLYVVRAVLNMHRGDYKLSFEIQRKDMLEIISPKTADGTCSVKCQRLDAQSWDMLNENVSMIIKKYNKNPGASGKAFGELRKIDKQIRFTKTAFSDKQEVLGCFLKKGKKEYRLKLLVRNIENSGRRLNYVIEGKGARKVKESRKNGRRKVIKAGKITEKKKKGELFWVDGGSLDIPPGKGKVKLRVEGDGPKAMLTRKKAKRVFITKGDLGAEFPFEWLHRYDITF